MFGIKDFGRTRSYRRACSFWIIALVWLAGSLPVSAQTTQNVNVTGSPAPGHDWELYRQENEVSCGVNPNNELIMLCAFNWYGYADLPKKLGDAWIAMSTTRDGENFTHEPLTGTIGKEYLGFGFAADPTVMTFPGGAIITSIIGDRNGNSKMVAQRLVEMNRETGSPYAQEFRQQEVSFIQGVNFIDKPDAKIIIKPGGGFREVIITTNEIDDDPDSETYGQLRQETRQWPEFTVCVAYAVFGGSNQNIRTFATCSDDFGLEGTWSNPRQISQSVTGGLDQGLTIASIDETVLYVARRFDSGDGDAIIGALAKDRGFRPGKVFEITDICPFDQQTAPSLENPDRASVRSLGFPWVSATDTHFVLAYVDRPRDAQGNCLPSYDDIPGVGGTRVMLRTSKDGRNWSNPEPVLPFENQPIHFEFQPNISCARGACNVVYYSTLTESLAFEQLLTDMSGNDLVAERYWETNEFIEDFDVFDAGGLNQVLRFRRSVDVYSTKVKIRATGQTGEPDLLPPVRISQYQLDYDENGDAFEIEWNALGKLIFGGMTAPFHGDYIANAVSEWRKNPITKVYESNAGPIGSVDDPINRVRYFAAWTDNRRIRGFVYDDSNYVEDEIEPTALPYEVPQQTAQGTSIDDPGANDVVGEMEAETLVADSDDAVPTSEMPRAAAPGGPMEAARAAVTRQRPDRFASAYALRSEGLVDPNPNAPTCTPDISNYPYPGAQTNIKNSEIYGTIVEDEVRLVSPNVAKSLNRFNDNFNIPLQRGFVLGADNTSPDNVRRLRLVIANQPGETPMSPDQYVPAPSNDDASILPKARASWRQLPYRPTFTTAPNIVEVVEVEPLSLEYVTLFVVGTINDAPVTVYAYDDETDELVSQITVNGETEAGDLIDPGTTGESVNVVEIHDPTLIEPIWSDLEIIPLAEEYENPNLRSPNFRSPNFRSTDYMNPNLRSPNLRSPNYRSETQESTSLQNPNLRSPNLRSDSFVDVTYTVESENNTITAVNADFAYGGTELDGDNVQVIAWKEDQLATAQDCDPGFITESKVISAKANPNFRSLAPADIQEPFQGEVSFPLYPSGLSSQVNVTVRIFCNEAAGECSDLIEMDQINPDDPEGPPVSKVQKLLGYNFWAQKANTGKDEIDTDNEQIIKDVIPPAFDPPLVDGTTYSFDASGSDPNAAATVDLVADLSLKAYDNCDPLVSNCSDSEVAVTCYINDATGQNEMPFSVPLGSSTAQCDTAPDSSPAKNFNSWTGFVLIEDNEAPQVSIPATELIVPPDNASGALVNYLGTGVWADPLAEITFSDNISKDGYVYPELSCEPASGSQFNLDKPTTVICTAIDAGPCNPDASASCVVDADFPDGHNVTTDSFTVIVRDLEAPVISCKDSDGNDCDVLPPIEQEADAVETQVTLIAPQVTDPDNIDPDPAVNAYLDANCTTPAPAQFPLGTTVITWCATDFAGNTSTIEQSIIIKDRTPPVVTVNFPDGSSQITNSLSGEYVSFEVNVDEIFPDAASIACETAPDSPISSGDLFPVGDTTVTCYASDTSGNQGSGSATVKIVFEYLPSGITGKTSGKTGSSFPLAWAWTDDNLTPLTVSDQTLTIERGTCPGDGFSAQDPGKSGLRQDTDGSYLYNLQAVDPSTNEPWVIEQNKGDPFCFTVAPPAGDPQFINLTIRP
jgi:hypothetical protein